MADEPRQINFTIVPADDERHGPRVYANFCARLAHAVRLHADVLRGAAAVGAGHPATPSRTTSSRRRCAPGSCVPVQVLPSLIAALQDQLRIVQRVVRQRAAGPRDRCTSVARGLMAAEDPPTCRRHRGAGRQHPGRRHGAALPQRRSSCSWRPSCPRSRPTPASTRSRRRCSRRYPDARGAGGAPSRGRRARWSSRPGSSGRRRGRSSGMARALVEQARRRGARARWTRWSSCPASAARRPTSCSATRSASPGCRSIGTCCASANRIGIADSDDPERVEQQLTGALPPGWWTRASDTLILHGRRVCKPDAAVRPVRRQRRCARSHAAAAGLPRAGRLARRRGAARPPSPAAKKPAAARTPMTRARFEQLVADAIRTIPRRFRDQLQQHRRHRRRRAVATRCSTRWRSNRPTRCSASTRARR